MQINPGGRLDTRDIIGRDNEIARYWRILQRQGLVLSAERRIGKTHILFKMREECQRGYVPFYQDLEAVHSAADLIRPIHVAVRDSSGTLLKVKAFIAKWSTMLPQRIGSLDLPTADGSWQALLTDVFDDLINSAGDNTLILMLWDEFPLMLHNLQRREGPVYTHPSAGSLARLTNCPGRPFALPVHGFSRSSPRASIPARGRKYQ